MKLKSNDQQYQSSDRIIIIKDILDVISMACRYCTMATSTIFETFHEITSGYLRATCITQRTTKSRMS